MRTSLSHVPLSDLAVVALPGVAFAQAWTPGSEIVGQSVQVTTNGVTNTVYLDPGGAARIVTPGGNTVPEPGPRRAASCASAPAPPRNAGLIPDRSRPASR